MRTPLSPWSTTRPAPSAAGRRRPTPPRLPPARRRAGAGRRPPHRGSRTAARRPLGRPCSLGGYLGVPARLRSAFFLLRNSSSCTSGAGIFFTWLAPQCPSDHDSALTSPLIQFEEPRPDSSPTLPFFLGSSEAPHRRETMLAAANVAFPPAVSSSQVKITRQGILILQPCVLPFIFVLLSFAGLDDFQGVFLEMSSRTDVSWVLPIGGANIFPAPLLWYEGFPTVLFGLLVYPWTQDQFTLERQFSCVLMLIKLVNMLSFIALGYNRLFGMC